MPVSLDELGPPSRRTSWWGRNWLWAVPASCLGCVLIPAGCIAAIGLVSLGLVRSSEPYEQALERARDDPRVVEALGEPIEAGWVTHGRLEVDPGRGEAEFSLPVSGPDGSATIHVRAEKESGRWRFDRLEAEIDGSGARFDLLSPGIPGSEPGSGDRHDGSAAGSPRAPPPE